MQENSLRTVKVHWGQILSCDPSKILADGVTVTPWSHDSVECFVWEGGGIVGAPERLCGELRGQIKYITFDKACDDARQLVTSLANVNNVLGPQFVGYCDQTTFDPVESDARKIESDQLKPLRDACSGG